MKHILMIASLAAAALVGCGGGGGGAGGGVPASLVATSPPAAPPAASASPAAGDCTVAYWGDSISALTAPRLDPRITVHAHSVVGGTAQAAQTAFLQDPLAEPIVVLEYGTNDANGGSDLEAPLSSMIDRASSLHRTIILTGIPHETAGAVAVEANYNFWMSTLNLPYVNWGSTSGGLMADGVHPDDAYQQVLADALSAKILESCKK